MNFNFLGFYSFYRVLLKFFNAFFIFCQATAIMAPVAIKSVFAQFTYLYPAIFLAFWAYQLGFGHLRLIFSFWIVNKHHKLLTLLKEIV